MISSIYDSQEEFLRNLREVIEALRKFGIKAKGVVSVKRRDDSAI